MTAAEIARLLQQHRRRFLMRDRCRAGCVEPCATRTGLKNNPADYRVGKWTSAEIERRAAEILGRRQAQS